MEYQYRESKHQGLLKSQKIVSQKNRKLIAHQNLDKISKIPPELIIKVLELFFNEHFLIIGGVCKTLEEEAEILPLSSALMGIVGSYGLKDLFKTYTEVQIVRRADLM